MSHAGRLASGLGRARRRVGRAGQVGVRMREKGPKMATEPRSGTKRRDSGAPSEGAPGKRPGREFRTHARRGRSVPERGSVAIFRPFSCMRTPPCPARPTRRRARLNPEVDLPASDSIPVLLSLSLLSLSDDIPALSSHPFPTLLPLLATQSRVLRLVRNPHGEPFPRRLLDGRAVERSTRFAHLRKALSRWWFCS